MGEFSRPELVSFKLKNFHLLANLLKVESAAGTSDAFLEYGLVELCFIFYLSNVFKSRNEILERKLF